MFFGCGLVVNLIVLPRLLFGSARGRLSLWSALLRQVTPFKVKPGDPPFILLSPILTIYPTWFHKFADYTYVGRQFYVCFAADNAPTHTPSRTKMPPMTKVNVTTSPNSQAPMTTVTTGKSRNEYEVAEAVQRSSTNR